MRLSAPSACSTASALRPRESNRSTRPPCRRDPGQGAGYSRRGAAVHVRPKSSVRASGNETKVVVLHVVGDRDVAAKGRAAGTLSSWSSSAVPKRRRRGAPGSAGEACLPGGRRSSWRERRQMVVAARRARANHRALASSRQGDRRARDVCTWRGDGTLARDVIAGSRPRRLANNVLYCLHPRTIQRLVGPEVWVTSVKSRW